MLKIDFYAQQFARYSANAIELESDKPVRFRLPDGDRETAKALDHAQLVGIIQEAAPPIVIEALRTQRRASFRHRSEEGVEVTVEVEVSPDAWTVRISKPAADAPRGAPRPPVGRAPLAPPVGAGAPSPGIETNQVAGLPPQAGGGVRGPVGGEPAQDFGAAPVRTAVRAGVDVSIPLDSPGIGAYVPPIASPAGAGAQPAPRPAPVAAPRDEPPAPRFAGEGKRISLGNEEPKINYYLRMMKAVDASDLHMSSGVTPMIRRHGEMVPLEDRGPLTDAEMRTLVDEIIPDRNRHEFEESNDADFAHQIPGLARFRANVFRDRRGTGAVFRQIPYEIVSAEKLGIPKRVLDLCWLTKGLVLVTGPTGSGKSTTLAALIDFINDNRSDHLITIEDPVEFVHENKKCLVNQREIGTHTKSFKSALRAALREDPDIVLVGEMRDLETISIAVETAETGHLVFGTLHTTSAPSTVDRIIDQFPPEQQGQIRVMLSESLRGVVSQVLCKKKGGGRIAAYEILIGNAAVANLIREGKTFQLRSVMQTGRNLGMQTMNDHLLDHVKKGLVEPMEAYMKSNDKILMKEALTRDGHKLELTE